MNASESSSVSGVRSPRPRGRERRLGRVFAIAAGLLLSLSASVEGQALSRGGGFAALVNGKPITFYELELAVDRRLLAVRGKYPPEVIEQQRPATRQLVLDELITERLLLDRCNRRKITVRPEEVDLWVQSEIDRFRAQGDGSIGDVTDFFEEWKANFGENEEQARGTIRNRIRIRRLLDSIYQPEYISPAELRSYFRNNPEEFSTPTMHRFRQIILPADDPQTKDLITELQRQIAAGASFADLAREYSKGPRRESGGEWERSDAALDSWLAPIPATVRNTPVGSVSEPVFSSPTRVHLILVENREEGRLKDFGESQNEIRSRLRSQRENLQRQRFEEELRKSAEVRTFLEQGP